MTINSTKDLDMNPENFFWYHYQDDYIDTDDVIATNKQYFDELNSNVSEGNEPRYNDLIIMYFRHSIESIALIIGMIIMFRLIYIS